MDTHEKKTTRFILVTVLAWLLSTSFILFARSPYGGIKYTRNYTRLEYNNQNQNWGILQDKRGIMYAANHGGIMEYDGVSWREIHIPNNTVRSLAMDQNGRIFAGGIDEIGVLTPDSKGDLRYVSLIPHLDGKYRNFSNVWRTHAVSSGVYFCTSKYLLFWNNKKIICKAKAKGSFSAPFLCNRTLYVRVNGTGLLVPGKKNLQLLPGGEFFASRGIYMLVEYAPGVLLIGTGSDGFFLYRQGKLTPFETEARGYIDKNRLSCGIRLSSGDFALGTRHGGVVVIGPQGKVKHLFDKTSGLQDDCIKYIYQDVQGNLWLCLDEGISKIEYASPVSIYDDRHRLPGNVSSITRHNGSLYAGTTRGLFLYKPVPHFPSRGQFRPVPGISGTCRSLVSTGDTLLAAAGNGIFQIQEIQNGIKQNNNNINIRNILPDMTFTLYRSPSAPHRIWAGTRRGLVSLVRQSLPKKNNQAQWVVEHRFPSIKAQIQTIVEDKKGHLWLGTRTKGVLRVEIPPAGTPPHPRVTDFDSTRQLPPGETGVFTAAGHVIFATKNGLYRFDNNTKTILPYTTFGSQFAGGPNGRSVYLIHEDHKKNVWLHSRTRNFLAVPQPGGTYTLDEKSFKRIPIAHVSAIYSEPGITGAWFASVDGLIYFDAHRGKNTGFPFPALIRDVSVNGKTVYRGGSPTPFHLPPVPYSERNIRFRFAAPFFQAESRTTYQCFMKGYDDQWSPWSPGTAGNYTNLYPGSYRFRVRARNVFGDISREAEFQFQVLPPWYRTWWAFVLYALSALLVLFMTVKWRSRKLEKEKQQLEHIIDERTSEINNQKHQLLEQAEKLKEMDKVKSRFFANISHEFRTPLTLIMGPLEQMIPQCPEPAQEKKLRMMLRNSQRLLGLINQLLELSKFDSGKVKLNASLLDIVPILKGITASFEILTRQHDMDLTFHVEKNLENEKNTRIYIDPVKIEDVMSNLLGNAVKFTPAGGKITVSVKKKPPGKTQDKKFPYGSLEIVISDTGPGIPPEQLLKIFDHFYQSQSTYEHHRKGSGIGLAIAKELIELHHGTIRADSIEGKGTRLIIRLPMGDAHLEPGEIVDTPAGSIEPLHTELDGAEEETGQEIEHPMDIDDNRDDDRDKDIILVVEDSTDMRRYIKDSLQPLYLVETATDGREGIRKAKDFIPDLIISDIMMPGIDGYELCRELKKERETSHIPIILLTAKAAEDSVIEGLETGADDYVTKPFNTTLLCARIKNLIELRKHAQQTIHREMTLRPAKIPVSPVDREFMRDLKEVIEANIADPDFNVTQLGKKLYMSRTSLYRKILALCGEPPTEFIRSYRLKRGAELLEKSSVTVLEVALDVGFSSANYFTKCFKKKFQLSPAVFRESKKNP